MTLSEQKHPGRDGRIAYSINEASAVTGICRDSLYKQINSGRLIARKVGRRTVIAAGDLAKFLQDLPQVGKAA